MTNPHEGWPGSGPEGWGGPGPEGQQPPPQRKISGIGVVVGALGVPVPLIALMVVVASLSPLLSLLVFVAAVIGAFVLLVAQPDPFRRGVGAGLLIAVGAVLLLFGACFAILSQAQFG